MLNDIFLWARRWLLKSLQENIFSASLHAISTVLISDQMDTPNNNPTNFPISSVATCNPNSSESCSLNTSLHLHRNIFYFSLTVGHSKN